MEVQTYEFQPFDIPHLTDEENEMVHLTNSLLDRLARKQASKDRFENVKEIEPPSKKLRFYESPTATAIVLTPEEMRYQDSQSRASWISNNGAGYFGKFSITKNSGFFYFFFDFVHESHVMGKKTSILPII
jgi:hypothetical protein